MNFDQPSLALGGGFKAGPIGICDICHNKAELGKWEDGRNICGDCHEAMAAGKQRNIESGKVTPERNPEPLPYDSRKWQEVVSPASAWTSADSGERSFYLEVIKSATKETVAKVIENLVNSGVLHLDFHKIIQNERWFSIIDLRRIASEVDPSFENPMPRPDKKVSVKPRRKRCLTKQSSRMHQSKNQSFQLPEPKLQPLQPQL